MTKNKTNYSTPRLKTVNLEIRDFNYYVKDKFNVDLVELDFNFGLKMLTQKKLEIFIHLQFVYKSKKKDEEEFPIFHSDHIIEIEFSKSPKPKNTFEVELVAHLLGTSLIMVKGYYDTITNGYLLNKVPLPVFNPIELIKVKYSDIIEDNMIAIS